MINSHGMPGQWQPRRLIGNKMNAENLKLRSSSCSLGCEITSVVNTANSSFRVCRTEANLDHVITGRQNNRLLSPPVLWAQWVTSYPKYSKGAQVQYMGSNMWMAAPPMASVWDVGLSNVLAQPCSQMTRYGEVSTKTTCCFLDMSHRGTKCLWHAYGQPSENISTKGIIWGGILWIF